MSCIELKPHLISYYYLLAMIAEVQKKNIQLLTLVSRKIFTFYQM